MVFAREVALQLSNYLLSNTATAWSEEMLRAASTSLQRKDSIMDRNQVQNLDGKVREESMTEIGV
jgi:hypothetical protein